MTSIDMSTTHQTRPHQMPLAVQLLSTVFFGVFGILAVIFAFKSSWVAGLIVAVVLGWRGGFAPGIGQSSGMPELADVMPLAPEAEARSSGNASFDAYKADTLRRLEEEQVSFEGFLERLRSAKDKAEFDAFLDNRARRVSGEMDDGDAISIEK